MNDKRPTGMAPELGVGYQGNPIVRTLKESELPEVLAAWREAAELYTPSTAELSMNVPFFSDSFESKSDQIKIRMDFEFGFQVARPETRMLIANVTNRRVFDYGVWKIAQHKRKMNMRVIRKKLLHLGLKMCHTERQRTNFLLNFIIAQRK